MADDPNGVDTEVTLANWRSAPFSSWAFRNIGRLMPVTDIANDPAAVWTLRDQPRSLEGFRLATPERELGFSDFLAATATDAIVVLKDGVVVAESYAEGMGPHSRHIIMSATKSVVGLIAGILAEGGLIDIDAEVGSYVPEVAATAYHGATIRQLLDMRGGVVFDVAHQRAYDAATHWLPTAPGAPPPDLHAFFTGISLPARPHDGPFRYVSANTDLLGWAMERAAGESFAALTSRLFWGPVGAEDAAFITVDGRGAPRCTGGFCATARDLARIGQLVLEGGRREGHAIVPAAWIEDIGANGDEKAWARGEFAMSFGRRPMHYRSGWYVTRNDPKLLFAMGIHGQNLFVDPDGRMVVAKLSSQHEPVDGRAVALTHRAVAELRRCLG